MFHNIYKLYFLNISETSSIIFASIIVFVILKIIRRSPFDDNPSPATIHVSPSKIPGGSENGMRLPLGCVIIPLYPISADGSEIFTLVEILSWSTRLNMGWGLVDK
tara:strand:+ start:392 stop:709 length:318 start_codon:yes stop_codon:yes gene_type:complete